MRWHALEPASADVDETCEDDDPTGAAARPRPTTPVVVTENGIATADDTQRITFIDEALRGLAAAVTDGADVRGYFHWSLLDNLEWFHGYRPTFGLIAVDRTSFVRTPKPSLAWLGAYRARHASS